jgi:hypothetical protein
MRNSTNKTSHKTMKRLLTTLFGLLCILMLHAQIKGEEIRVLVTPNHADWTYQLGETATFTVRVLKSECLLPGVTIDYELGPEMYQTDAKKDVVLKDGTYTLKAKLTKPGFIRCDVKAHVGQRTYEGRAAAAYAPEQIQATTVNPQDFDLELHPRGGSPDPPQPHHGTAARALHRQGERVSSQLPEHPRGQPHLRHPVRAQGRG